MMVLRFAAGPIVHRLQPLGLLAVCSALAIAGLLLLSFSTGMMVLIAATVYGIGKTFFWPTMLGVVSEQCPKGGALTLNMIAGIGMLAAGVIGNPLFGNIQDHAMDERLLERAPELHARVVGPQQSSVFGDYRALDKTALAVLPPADAAEVAIVKHEAQRKVLRTAAIFPAAMLVVYLGLMAWFRARGGYKPVVLAGSA
jgi:MFS family permease